MRKAKPTAAEPMTRKAPVKTTPEKKAPAESRVTTKPEPEAAPASLPPAVSLSVTSPRSRKAGRQNSLAILTEGVIEALAAAGGADYLLAIARDDPKTFCALLTRILPGRIEGRAEGKADSGVKLRWDVPARKGSAE